MSVSIGISQNFPRCPCPALLTKISTGSLLCLISSTISCADFLSPEVFCYDANRDAMLAFEFGRQLLQFAFHRRDKHERVPMFCEFVCKMKTNPTRCSCDQNCFRFHHK